MLNEHNLKKGGQQFQPLFPMDCPDRAVIHAILEGKVHGKLFLNDKKNACLLTTAAFNFIAGNVDDHFLEECLKIIPKTTAAFLINCSGSYAFPQDLPYKVRLHYSGTADDIVDLPQELDNEINDKFRLTNINEILFEQCHWQTRFLELYQSKEQFLKFGYASVLLDESQIVAELYGIVGGQYLEIGAFVHEKYRGYRFIPFMVAHSMRHYCRNHYLHMMGSCGIDNISSEKSMIYFGLKKDFEYSVLDIGSMPGVKS